MIYVIITPSRMCSTSRVVRGYGANCASSFFASSRSVPSKSAEGLWVAHASNVVQYKQAVRASPSAGDAFGLSASRVVG